MSNHGNPWNTGDKELLFRMCGDGSDLESITRALGRSKMSVLIMLEKHGRSIQYTPDTGDKTSKIRCRGNHNADDRKTWYEANKEEVDIIMEGMDEQSRRYMLKAIGYWNDENIAASNARIAKQCASERKAASWAKRKAMKLQRTPKWNTKEDNESMVLAFSERTATTKRTGIHHHVDHDIPLQGELVSGLHVPTNLKVITAANNTSKSNKFDITQNWVLTEPDENGRCTMIPLTSTSQGIILLS